MSTLETLPANMDVDAEHVGGAEPVAPAFPPPQQPVTPQVLPAAPVQLTPDMIQELVKSGQLVIPMAPVAPAEPRTVVTQPAQPVPREQPLEVQGQPAQPVPPKEPLVPAVGQPDQQPAQAVPQQPLKVQGEPAAPPQQPLVPADVKGQSLATPKQSPEVQGQPAQALEVAQQSVPPPPRQAAEVQPASSPKQGAEVQPALALAAVPRPTKPEIGDAELAAMGWKVDKTCRPQASPQTSPMASPTQVEARDLQRGKSQVFSENDGTKPGSESQKPQSAPAGPQPQTHKAHQFNQPAIKVPPVQIVQVPAPAEKTKEQQEYSRRAAANLISRLQNNPARLEGLPDLKKLVFDGSRKSELISMLCEQGGSLEQVNAKLVVQEETGKLQINRKKALRYTKKQMNDMYGDDAAGVMKHKEAIGMVEDDENNPGGFVYLISQKEDEAENYNRSGSWLELVQTWWGKKVLVKAFKP